MPHKPSGSLIVLRIPVGLQGQQCREIGDTVVEQPYRSGVPFVVVVLLELVFGDTFGDGCVYECVVADEDADMADAVTSGLEKYQVAWFEFASLYLLTDTGHLTRCTWKFHAEDPIIHEPHKTRAIETRGCLTAEPVANSEELFYVAEKSVH